MTNAVAVAAEDGDAGKCALHAGAVKPMVMLRMRRTVCIALVIGLSACTQQTLPSWVTATPTAPTESANVLASLVIAPLVVFGGQAAEGTVTVGLPIGATVLLSTDNPTVSVPASVSIPAGQTAASFPIAAHSVNGDTLVTITATLGGISDVAPLMVWPPLGTAANSFWYERGADSTYGRYTSDDAAFVAACRGYSVDVLVNSEWRVVFSTSGGRPISRGTYDIRVPGPNGLSHGFSAFRVGEGSLLCPQLAMDGTFTIDDADLAVNGLVRRFAARYDFRCRDGSAAFRGEIRLTNVRHDPTFPQRCESASSSGSRSDR